VGGIQMDNNEKDIFSDLEADIEGDWKEIQLKIRKEKAKEVRLNEPKRPYFPSFKEFYDILVDIAYGTNEYELKYGVQRLIRGIIHGADSGILPSSITKLWEAICNPRDFGVISNCTCERCCNKFDVTYRTNYHNPVRVYNLDDMFSLSAEELKMKHFVVYCPICGINLTTLTNANLVSVSLSPKDTYDDEYRRERRYDIKRKF
jgi:hypothetical protein